jgi:uncharacterized membrane-anchored protein
MFPTTLSRSALVLALTLVTSVVLAQDKPSQKPKGITGPGKGVMLDVGQIDVPVGYEFFDGKTTRAFMKSVGEPISGQEVGLLMPTNGNFTVFFEFNDIGYVKDDDKDKLDADKLLASIKRGTEEGNKERAKAGNPPLEIVGWDMPPRYDEKTHNLEWAIRARSAGEDILNYNTRLLGRKGVMEVVLVIDPEKLQETLPAFRQALAGYNFQGGQTYAEYRSGDKVAKYGLAALVVGGAAVGAAKLGLFATLAVLLKKAWKLIVVAIAAIATAVKKFFGGKGARTE